MLAPCKSLQQPIDPGGSLLNQAGARSRQFARLPLRAIRNEIATDCTVAYLVGRPLPFLGVSVLRLDTALTFAER
jgi:hypothetical protein